MLLQCKLCEGFIPNASSQCPNCVIPTAPTRKIKAYRQVKTAATVVSAGMISMTLMACYGAPPDAMLTNTDTQPQPRVEKSPKPLKEEKDSQNKNQE